MSSLRTQRDPERERSCAHLGPAALRWRRIAVAFATTNTCVYGSLRSQGRRTVLCVCRFKFQNHVVPADAGTHTPRPRVFGMVANDFCSNKYLCLWVPAFAGTTNCMVRLQIRISNGMPVGRRDFAISPLVRASFIGTSCPLKIRGRRECRTLGASAAACAVVESTRVSHHGHAANVRHSPRNGFNGFLRALPGDRACLPPSPLRSLLLKSLTPASGRQDHTTSPSAGQRVRQRAAHVHRIPPHVRDDRETPLGWDGTESQ
jgi:hypothetical protein